MQSTDERRCEVGLVCNGETTAETIHAEVEKLDHAATQALPAHIQALASPEHVAVLKSISHEAKSRVRLPFNTSGFWKTCLCPCPTPVATRPTA